MQDKQSWEESKSKIQELVGEATMCWTKEPQGVFQSGKDSRICDDIFSIISQEIQKAREEKDKEWRGKIKELGEHMVNQRAIRFPEFIKGINKAGKSFLELLK